VVLREGERYTVEHCLELWPSVRARLLDAARQCSEQGEEQMALQLQMAIQLAEEEYLTLQATTGEG